MSEVKTLHFEGLLRVGRNPSTPYVGDAEPLWKNRDVLDELREAAGWGNNVQCAVQVTFPNHHLSAEGTLDLDEGSTGYGTYTPGEPSKFCVGESDVLDFLDDYDGQHVVIDIAIPGRLV